MNEAEKIINSGVFKLTIEQLNTAVFITNLSGEIVYVNPYFVQKTGYTAEEAIGKTPSIISSGQHSSDFYKDLWKTILSGVTWKGEIINKKKNGETYCSEVTISSIKDNDGKIINYVAIEHDISAQKEALAKSVRRENLLNDIQFLSDTGGWHYEVNKGAMFWTDQLYKIYGLKKDNATMLFEESLSCHHPDDRLQLKKAFSKLLSDGEPYDLTMRITDFMGNQKWIRTTTRAARDEQGVIHRVYGSVMDVTKNVAVKESLYSSYRERGVLLSEIHHRVKNNLAMISGLLQLQMMGMSDNEKKEVLNKSIYRINSISLIHEELYRAQNFSEISLASSIRAQAKEMNRIFDSGTEIDFEFDLEDVIVTINQAQPVSLLIHEILSNSLKYAFKGREHGRIIIRLRCRDDVINLYVSDNGSGADTEKISESNTLGYLLIKNLILQLDAHSTIRSSGGLSYELSFKKEHTSRSDAQHELDHIMYMKAENLRSQTG